MISKKGSVWWMQKRVPVRYKDVESRKVVWIKLATDSKRRAERKAPRVWDNMIKSWDALLAGDVRAAEVHFNAARDKAREMGLEYLTPGSIAELPLPEIMQRVQMAKEGEEPRDDTLLWPREDIFCGASRGLRRQ